MLQKTPQARMWFDCLQPSHPRFPDSRLVSLFPHSLFSCSSLQICCHIKADPNIQRGPSEEYLGPHLPPLPGETICTPHIYEKRPSNADHQKVSSLIRYQI